MKSMHNMKTNTNSYLWIALVFSFSFSLAQNNSVTIGSTSTNNKAVLWLVPSGGQGLLLPSLPSATRTGMNVQATDAGMTVFDSDQKALYYWNGTSWVSLSNNGIPVITLSGDVTGATTASIVQAIQGNKVQAITPSDQQVLKWNNANKQWEPSADNVGPTYTQGTGISIANNTISVVNGGITNTQLATNAVADNNISSVSPAKLTQAGASTGQVLIWTGSAWTASNQNAQLQSDWNQATTTSLDYIKNKPALAAVAISGSYTDLSNKPTIPAAQIQSDWNQATNTSLDFIKNKPTFKTVNGTSVLGTGDIAISTSGTQMNSDWDATSGVTQILHKPTLATVATSGKYTDLTNTPSLKIVATSGSYNDLTNQPTIPTKVSDLSNDEQYVKESDLATVATSGKYTDLTNTPTIPAAQIQSDWNQATTTSADYIKNKPALSAVATSGSYTDLSNKPTIPAAQLQSDWNQATTTSLDYIKNKPALGSLAALSTVSSTQITDGTIIASDLNQMGATSGQVMKWNGTTNKWEAGDDNIGIVGGTVSSVGLTMPTMFNVTNSTITSSGTIGVTLNSQSAGTVLAGPATGSAVPAFRTLTATDIPTLNQSTTGTASNITATSNSTLTTLSLLSLPTTQLSGTIANTQLANNSFSIGTTSISLGRAAAAQALTGITSIDGSAATLTTGRTINIDLSTTATQNFNGSQDITTGVTGTLPIAGGGTGATSVTANTLIKGNTAGTAQTASQIYDDGSNVGIGTTNLPQEKLDVNGAALLERITVPTTTTDRLYNVSGNLFWNGNNISASGGGWSLSGNNGTDSLTNFIGTTGAQPLIFKTNGTERMRIGRGGIVTFNANLDEYPPNANKGNFKFAAYNGGGHPALGLDNAGVMIGDINGDAFSTYFYTDFENVGNFQFMNGNVGIGTDAPKNSLDVGGGTVVGSSYAGVNSAPSDGLLVQGNVGIGTISPADKLDVVGNVTITGQLSIANSALSYPNPWEIRSGAFGKPTQVGNTLAFYSDVTGSTALTLNANSSSGTTGANLYGDLAVTGTVTQGSDRKLKKDIRGMDNMLGKVMQLKPSNYYFRSDEFDFMSLPKEKQYGLIAQEVESLFPELVTTMYSYKKDGQEFAYKGVNYMMFAPIVIKAIQEQQTQIDELKAANKKLEDRLAAIEALLQNGNNPLNNSEGTTVKASAKK